MKEIKLIFGDVLVNQSLSVEIEKNNEDYSISTIFKELRTQTGQATIGVNTNQTAQNYVNALALDYTILSNITITVVRNVVIFSYDENVIELKFFQGTTISSGTVVEASNVFNLKYWFEFTDVQGVQHRVDILQSGFTDLSLQIYGSCSLEYSETKDSLEAIRGCGLKIDLEANSNLNFYDLYSEEERTFSVIYKRNDEILFNGWLSPEGIYESLVSDKWIISLDCTDGIGFLKNLSYVDSNGFNYVGKQSMLEIVSNCLKRTKIVQDIYVNIDIIYNGMQFYQDVLMQTYLNVDRFVKDDGETIEDCDKVLRSVLELFGAVLVSYKGKWLIFKPNTLAIKQNIYFFPYDYEGISLGQKKLIDFTESLGSQIDGYYPHHVNGNQQKTITNSIGAFRIDYNFGLVKGFVDNIFLTSLSDTDIPDFTILNSDFLGFTPNRDGVILDKSISNIAILKLSDTITIAKSSVIELITRFNMPTPFTNGRIEIKLITSLETYYLNKTKATFSNPFSSNLSYESEWVTEQTFLNFDFWTSGVFNETIVTSQTPELGTIVVTIYNSYNTEGNNQQGAVLNKFDLKPNSVDDGTKGVTYTFERETNPSSKIEKNKEIFNADNPSDVYLGTIYKSNKTNPTEQWRRLNEISFNRSIVQIMGEERMKMYSKPRIVFSGDVFGYFNYLSVFTINNISGLFMPTSYNYDALNNITSLELTEIIDTNILNDIEFNTLPQYREPIKPTIKG